MADVKWEAAPSGLTSGDLNGWKRRMALACPSPKLGQMVVVETDDSDGKVIHIGYKCIRADGENSSWRRMKGTEIVITPETIIIRGAVTESGQQATLSDVCSGNASTSSGIPVTMSDDGPGVYLGDGVYVSAEDCWF